MTYWKGYMKDGKTVDEMTHKWQNVESDLIGLEFHIPGKDKEQVIALPKNMKYVQFKTASADIGGNNVEIESRVLGFVLGNNTVKIRVDEKTNNISIETS
jgi:hypothetical protein